MESKPVDSQSTGDEVEPTDWYEICERDDSSDAMQGDFFYFVRSCVIILLILC